MKKKNVSILNLNKKAISKITDVDVIGGTNVTNIDECPSVKVKPHCFSHETFITICECESNMC